MIPLPKAWRCRIPGAVLFAALALLAAGCAGTSVPPPTDDIGRMEYVRQAFAAGDYKQIELVVDEFLAARPGSRFMEEALYYKGRAYYERGMDLEAEEVFRKLRNDFPAGEFEAETLYYLALSLLSQSRGPMLDQTETRTAQIQFETFLARFPEHELAPRARGHLESIRNKLAEKAYLNGWGYLRRGALTAARFYFEEKVLAEFSDTEWAAPAMLGLAKSYAKTKSWADAVRWARGLIDLHPESAEVSEARDILKHAADAGFAVPDTAGVPVSGDSAAPEESAPPEPR